MARARAFLERLHRLWPWPATPGLDARESLANLGLTLGRYQVRVLHTPGHCPGGVCMAIGKDTKDTKEAKDTKENPMLFVGDTLFAGSIGRTDLPGGDMPTLLRSIREVLFSFPDDCVVWSGHGEATTIGREKRTNPFLI